MSMFYRSTRDDNVKVTASQAILKGLAADGGLFVPESIPSLDKSLEELSKMNYKEVAYEVMKLMLDDFTEEELKSCIDRAYDSKFDTEEMTPLVKVENEYFLELFHGATIAFKDMALSILPHLLTTSAKKNNVKNEIVILTATSGDTGKAALAGFANVPGTKIIVFYPKNGVSPIQEKQMVTQKGDNTYVIGIKGNFDDAQTGVKNIFSDKELEKVMNDAGFQFSSANSINIGRLVPQIVYYVYAYAKLLANGEIKDGEKINVVVPTGNFGNILAAYYAKKMGIPIGKLICASNQNNVLTDFFETGTYDMNRPFYTTISPSMDILESSNFERFLYYISGEDSERTAGWMKDLKATGKLTVNEEEFSRVKANFAGAYVDDEETKAIIEQVYNSYGYVMDPHTAVAMGAYMKELEKHPEDGARHTIIASTAHPFKFPTAICEALDIKVGDTPYESLDNISAVTGVAFPKQLEALKSKPLRFTKAIDKEDMKQEILDFVDTFSK